MYKAGLAWFHVWGWRKPHFKMMHELSPVGHSTVGSCAKVSYCQHFCLPKWLKSFKCMPWSHWPLSSSHQRQGLRKRIIRDGEDRSTGEKWHFFSNSIETINWPNRLGLSAHFMLQYGESSVANDDACVFNHGSEHWPKLGKTAYVRILSKVHIPFKVSWFHNSNGQWWYNVLLVRGF